MKPYLMTKLKNDIKKLDPTLEFHLRNVSVNARKMGCSGFVVNPANDKIIYISTDNNHGTITNALYRSAEHLKDWTGGMNRFASYRDLPQVVVTALRK